MNEKTPNLQTQAAMAEVRAMARNRMPELAESTVGVESFPNFTKPARQRWEAIPVDIRQRLLTNVWCGQCRHETTITNFSGTIKGGDLLLVGKCAECCGDLVPFGQGAQLGLGLLRTKHQIVFPNLLNAAMPTARLPGYQYRR